VDFPGIANSEYYVSLDKPCAVLTRTEEPTS
jgi:hypothetical protein